LLRLKATSMLKHAGKQGPSVTLLRAYKVEIKRPFGARANRCL